MIEAKIELDRLTDSKESRKDQVRRWAAAGALLLVALAGILLFPRRRRATRSGLKRMHRIAFVLLGVVLAGCDTRVAEDSTPGLVCRHAAGQCRIGGTACTSVAAESADDCNPELDPGGSFCCLDVVDAGAADASTNAGAACAQATGHCILAGFSCGAVAADSAQDCAAGGAFCCLTPDSGVP